MPEKEIMNQPSFPKSAIKLALLADEIRSRSSKTQFLVSDPIAVIGMGCRFPGGANNPQSFWSILENKIDAIREVPKDRWDLEYYYHQRQGEPGKVCTRWGGFLTSGINDFDAAYFDVSPREAGKMDPQQRLLLEVAIEALEDAGITQDHLRGSSTGVFTASYGVDNALLQYADPAEIEAYTLLGSQHGVSANRLSFLLDLKGPSLTIDTACSSSLVATHLACQSLRNSECRIALAAGVNLMLRPEVTIALSRGGFMAPDGRCKAFDAGGDGFVRGEGCGAVVLKRLSDAIADGNRVLAVIRGSAVNQDGRSNGFTAPNGLAQSALVRKALENAEIEPSQVGYIETHGTGTSLGDPIELEALNEVFGSSPRSEPCVLGALKTNIGHLEAAAGIAGLIKVILCLNRGLIPPNLHFTKLNPHISIDESKFLFPTETLQWPRAARSRIAGVSSFGVGGTNAHIIVEEAPQLPDDPLIDSAPYLLTLSAHSESALRSRSQTMGDFLMAETANASLSEICYTAAQHRTHHEFGIAAVGSTPHEMAEYLHSYAKTEAPNVAVGRKSRFRTSKLAFICSGQGQQWWGMGRGLFESESVFRESIEKCDALLRGYTRWTLLEELFKDEAKSRLEQTEIAQPAIFALQVALAALWRSWGIEPDVVAGHSVGEVAAACIAGALDLESAIKAIFHRGRLMQAATGKGRMAELAMPVRDAENLLSPYGDRLSIACVNSPNATVISGDIDAFEDLMERLHQGSTTVRKLPVSYAFHSAQMKASELELTRELSGLITGNLSIPMISTVTGSWIQGEELTPSYWGRNIRQTVLFSHAIRKLVEDGCSAFLELGPHPVLSRQMEETVANCGQNALILASLRRQRPERETTLKSLGALYVNGFSVDWDTVFPVHNRPISLPEYPWDKIPLPRCQPRPAPQIESSKNREGSPHPLLGTKLISPALQSIVFDSRINPDTMPFLRDHAVFGWPVLPAAAMIEMALASVSSVPAISNDSGGYTISNLTIREPLIFDFDKLAPVQTVIETEGDIATFRIFSYVGQENRWVLHAEGSLRPLLEPLAIDDTFDAIRSRCTQEELVESLYDRYAKHGMEFGESFRGLLQLYAAFGKHEVLAKVSLPAVLANQSDRFCMHPALLDACLQPWLALSPDEERSFLPVGFDQISVPNQLPQTSTAWSLLRISDHSGSDPGTLAANVLIFDEAGTPLARIDGLRLLPSTREAFLRFREPQHLLHEVQWAHRANADQFKRLAGNWLIFADRQGVGTQLGDLVRKQGGRCRLSFREEEGSGLAAPEAREGIKMALTEASLELGSVDRVVYLWSLNEFSPEHPIDPQWLSRTQERICGSLLYLVQELAGLRQDQPPLLHVITRGARTVHGSESTALDQVPVWGLGKTIMLEYPDLHCTLLDLDAVGDSREIQALFEQIQNAGEENEIALRNHSAYVPRLKRCAPRTKATIQGGIPKQVPAGPFQLNISERGMLDNLVIRDIQPRLPGKGEVSIRVRAAGLNFRDVLNALGMYPGEAGAPGNECAGEIIAVGEGVTGFKIGDPVLALADGCFASHVITSAQLTVKKPEAMSYEEAASIPIAFLTARYALIELAKLRAGERVLIHAAAGGVGLAAVQLALLAGAEIFTTAGSDRKREFLKSLGVQHILNSRTLDFADEVLKRTNGKGVDVVLNSLSGEFIEPSFSCLSTGGRFLEIGKLGILTHEQVESKNRQIDYHIIYLGELFLSQPAKIGAMLQSLIDDFQRGKLRHLPRRTFSIQNAVQAFRFMAQAKHIGKIVVHTGSAETHSSEITFDPKASYLITGGFGGLGQCLADWMVDNGARHLALMGRHPDHEASREIMARLQAKGARVLPLQGDVAAPEDVDRALRQIRGDLPPLRGIFHAAGILDDGILQSQEWSRFERIMAPKMAGAWNLHQRTQESNLDYFVLFSSLASLLGSRGQGNYAAANAFMDGLAHYRAAHGLPALSVNWGSWAEAGMASALGEREKERWSNIGVQGMTSAAALQALREALPGSQPQIGIFAIDWSKFATLYGGCLPASLSAMTAAKVSIETLPAARTDDFVEALKAAPADRQRTMLESHVRQHALKVLGLPSSHFLDPEQGLRDLGMDSLISMEFRNALQANLKKPLPATVAFDYPTVRALTDYLADMLALPKEVNSAPGSEKPGHELENMSDEEAEALLLKELNKR